MNNTIVWFDLPVNNIQRAIKFYNSVMEVDLQVVEQGPMKMAFFPFEPGVASGTLVEGSGTQPGASGATIYLNGGDDLAQPLSRVATAGGDVVMEKTDIGEHGFTARFKDLDGNIVALHSPN